MLLLRNWLHLFLKRALRFFSMTKSLFFIFGFLLFWKSITCVAFQRVSLGKRHCSGNPIGCISSLMPLVPSTHPKVNFLHLSNPSQSASFLRSQAAASPSQKLLPNNHPFLENRISRVVYEVKDLNAAYDFYVKHLGFQIIEEKDCNKQNRLCLVYPKKAPTIPLELRRCTILELVENKNYQTPENTHDFLGLGIHLNDIHFLNTSTFSQAGGSLVEPVAERRVNPSIYPDENAKEEKWQTNAFLYDLDGYGLEFVKEAVDDALHRIRFFTTSLKESSFFYEQILGMKLIRHKSHLVQTSYPWNQFPGMSKYFAYAENENDTTLLQVAYGYDEDKLIRKSGFHSLVIETKNLKAAEEFIRQQQWEAVRIASEENIPFLQIKDPDGWTIRMIETTS